MEVRLNDAIALKNARQRLKNKAEGNPSHIGLLNKAHLSRLFWPNNETTAPILMSRLLKDGKMFRPKWIRIICEEAEVDYNFIFGYPSEHDDDFKKLVN